MRNSHIVFRKNNLRLKEAEELTFNSDSLNNGKADPKKEVSVDPSSNGSPNLANDLNAAKTKNASASVFDVNLSNYSSSNSSKEPVVANFNVTDPVDASNTVKKAITSNPQLANAVKSGIAKGKINMKGNALNVTTNESIVFTKGELNEFLLNL